MSDDSISIIENANKVNVIEQTNDTISVQNESKVSTINNQNETIIVNQGSQGAAGEPGEGIPEGGSANQVLVKVNSTNYNTQWVDFITLDAVPTVFGRTGNIVAENSDYDASQVDNDSGVAGTFVSDALDTLAAALITLDNNVVHKTGNETIAGIKTHSNLQVFTPRAPHFFQPSLSGPATNLEFVIFFDKVQTNDATLTTLMQIPVLQGEAGILEIVVLGSNTTKTEVFGYKRIASYGNRTGTPVLNGTFDNIYTQETTGSAAIQQSVGTEVVNIRVTGLAATTINWAAHVTMMRHT